ncbi:MAG TPA: ABC transporter ATP-binding protein [Galbitalea sp.]|jgi:putative ABC transport system ATP-binding protein|nr:ABC transporter ATP-binding protein [Galbitalea sp.]
MTIESSTQPVPLVTVEHVTKTYRSAAGAVAALSDVSFTIAPGQLVALVGRSGSGKTTLLNCVGGLDEPTSGRVVVNGKDVTTMDEAARTALRRDELAFVFQTFGLVPMLSASENVGLPLRLRRVPAAEREERVGHLLDLVGLAGSAAQRPAELSGGQQQRVAIARALANSPRLLIADEPTGQLDADTGAAIMALLQSVVRTEGTTAIISTHDVSVQALADHTLRLADGVLVARHAS